MPHRLVGRLEQLLALRGPATSPPITRARPPEHDAEAAEHDDRDSRHPRRQDESTTASGTSWATARAPPSSPS